MSVARTREEYCELISKKMKPLDMTIIHNLAEAVNNYVKFKMAVMEYEADLPRRVEALRQQQAAEYAARHADDDDDNDFLSVIFAATKIAMLGAVAVFAPGILVGALPCIGAVGSVSNAIATGVAIGATDAVVQEVGVKLELQDKFSLNEVLESAVSAGVGASLSAASNVSLLKQATSVSIAAAATQATEIAIGTREHFDLKDVGLQAAAVVVAEGIKKLMPELSSQAGVERAKDIADIAANAAINAFLQSAVTGNPICALNLAATVAGSYAGRKAGEAIAETTNPSVPHETQTDEQSPATKLDLDKMCLIDDDNYQSKYKYTPIKKTSSTQFIDLMLKGKFDKAKQSVVDSAASDSIEKTLKEASSNNPEIEKMFEKAQKSANDKQHNDKIPTPENQSSFWKQYKENLIKDMHNCWGNKWDCAKRNAKETIQDIWNIATFSDSSLASNLKNVTLNDVEKGTLLALDLADPKKRVEVGARLAADLTEEAARGAVAGGAVASIARLPKLVSKAGTLFSSVKRVESLGKPWGSFEIDRPLPRTKHGDPLPDVNRPHTQLGKRGKGENTYKQAREWGYDEKGNLVPKRDIDFTDHGFPNEHPNPHQHDIYRDPNGGGYKRSEPKPLDKEELVNKNRNKCK